MTTDGGRALPTASAKTARVHADPVHQPVAALGKGRATVQHLGVLHEDRLARRQMKPVLARLVVQHLVQRIHRRQFLGGKPVAARLPDLGAIVADVLRSILFPQDRQRPLSERKYRAFQHRAHLGIKRGDDVPDRHHGRIAARLVRADHLKDAEIVRRRDVGAVGVQIQRLVGAAVRRRQAGSPGLLGVNPDLGERHAVPTFLRRTWLERRQVGQRSGEVRRKLVILGRRDPPHDDVMRRFSQRDRDLPGCRARPLFFSEKQRSRVRDYDK